LWTAARAQPAARGLPRTDPSARGVLLLDVAGEKYRLQHDEYEHQPHAAEELEIDPGIGREVVGDEQIGRSHEDEEARPAPVEAGPDAVGHAHLLAQHRADEISPEQRLGHGDDDAEQ